MLRILEHLRVPRPVAAQRNATAARKCSRNYSFQFKQPILSFVTLERERVYSSGAVALCTRVNFCKTGSIIVHRIRSVAPGKFSYHLRLAKRVERGRVALGFIETALNAELILVYEQLFGSLEPVLN